MTRAERFTVLLVAAVLVAGCAGAWQTQRLIAAHQQTRFDYEVGRLEYAVQERMSAYAQVLRGARGMFEASTEVTREDWRLYVGQLQLSRRYPGIRAMTFAPRVEPAELPAFIERVRREPPDKRFSSPEVLRQFALRAPPSAIAPVDSTLHVPVLYNEPLNADSERSLGIDMMRDAGRRASIEAALATDDAVLSTRLSVLRETGTQIGFIAYLPVYRQGRQLGWVTAVFHAEGFMRGLLGERDGVLEFEIYDGAQAGLETLLYSTGGVSADGEPLPLPARGDAAFETRRLLKMPGREWTVYSRARPGFVPLTEKAMPWLIVLGSLLTSLLLLAIARGAARWRAAAAQLEVQGRVLEQARAAAESATRAKGEFLANMSHEIRTPLNAILGSAELLGDDALSASQRTHLSTIARSGDHLLGVINDILDYSKIEAGMLELDQQPFDLRALIAEALQLVAVQAADKGLKLGGSFADGVPDVLLGDAVRLRQVLVNYLANAVKFTERGSITVEVSARPLEGTRQELRIAVRDTGIGIAPEQIERLFKSFSQVDASSTRRYGGTGLGLALCKRLAERMDGGVAVTSTLGQGSEFSFTFVAEAGPHLRLAETPAPAAHPGGRALRVLLVEDNPFNQQVGAGLLRSLGHEVEIAGDGAVAVAAVTRSDFDFVLMDVHMPVMDGLEATRRIRALPGRAQPRIFAVSASVLDHERAACLDAGMDRHLAKPIRRAQLEAALREVDTDGAPDLAALVADVGEAGARELVEAILADAESSLAALRAAAAQGETPSLAQLARQMGTACGMLRASRAQAAAEALEADTTAASAEQLIAAYTRMIGQLRQWAGKTA